MVKLLVRACSVARFIPTRAQSVISPCANPLLSPRVPSHFHLLPIRHLALRNLLSTSSPRSKSTRQENTRAEHTRPTQDIHGDVAKPRPCDKTRSSQGRANARPAKAASQHVQSCNPKSSGTATTSVLDHEPRTRGSPNAVKVVLDGRKCHVDSNGKQRAHAHSVRQPLKYVSTQHGHDTGKPKRTSNSSLEVDATSSDSQLVPRRAFDLKLVSEREEALERNPNLKDLAICRVAQSTGTEKAEQYLHRTFTNRAEILAALDEGAWSALRTVDAEAMLELSGEVKMSYSMRQMVRWRALKLRVWVEEKQNRVECSVRLRDIFLGPHADRRIISVLLAIPFGALMSLPLGVMMGIPLEALLLSWSPIFGIV